MTLDGIVITILLMNISIIVLRNTGNLEVNMSEIKFYLTMTGFNIFMVWMMS